MSSEENDIDDEDPFACGGGSDDEDDPFACGGGGGDGSDDEDDPFACGGDDDDEDPFACGGDAEKIDDEDDEGVIQETIQWKYGGSKCTYDTDMIHTFVMESVIRSVEAGTTRSEKIALLRSTKWNADELNASFWDRSESYRQRAGLFVDDVEVDDPFSDDVEAYRTIPSDKKPDDTFECPLAMEDVPYSDSWRVPCVNGDEDGSFVRLSTEGLVDDLLVLALNNAGENVLKWRHPNQKLESQTIPAVLWGNKGPIPDDMKRRYRERSVTQFVRSVPSRFRFCKNPRCELILSRPVSSNSRSDDDGDQTTTRTTTSEEVCLPIVCGGCEIEQCFHCGDTVHNPCTCATVRMWTEKNKDTNADAQWMLQNTRACPKCKKRVAQDGGCLKMICDRCHTDFCFKCGTTPYHGKNADGGYFKCKVIERKLQRQTSVEAANDRVKWKQSVRAEEYNNAFSKFLTYQSVAKNAKSELAKHVKRTKTRIQNSEKIPDTVADMRYLSDAVEEVYLGSLANAWTWVYRYFEYDDPDDEDEYSREVNLLDNYQDDLEHSISGLSELVEMKSSELDVILNDAAAYFHFKDRVSKMTTSIRRFRQSVVSDIEKGFPMLAKVTNVGLQEKRKIAWQYAQQWLRRKGLDEFGRALSKKLPDMTLKATRRRHRTLPQWTLRLIKLQHDFPGRPWEDLIPLKTSPPEPVWAWQDSSGTWNPYNDEAIDTIEHARTKGLASVEIGSAGRKYRIDIRSNRQTNVQTGGSRVIRRTMEPPETRAWCCTACGYRMGDGKIKICQGCNRKRTKRKRIRR